MGCRAFKAGMIYDLLQAKGGLTTMEIAKEIGSVYKIAGQMLRRLKRLRIVHPVPLGTRVLWRLANGAKRPVDGRAAWSEAHHAAWERHQQGRKPFRTTPYPKLYAKTALEQHWPSPVRVPK